MPPPIIRLSTTSSIFAITEIFEETLAPPMIAVTGPLGLSINFLRLAISFSRRIPGLFKSKNLAIVAVEACSLWVVP